MHGMEIFDDAQRKLMWDFGLAIGLSTSTSDLLSSLPSANFRRSGFFIGKKRIQDQWARKGGMPC